MPSSPPSVSAAARPVVGDAPAAKGWDRTATLAAALMSSRRRSTLALIVVFWIFTFAAMTVRGAFVETLPFSVLGPRRALLCVFGGLLCWVMTRTFELKRFRSFAERAAWAVLGALIMAMVHEAFHFVTYRVILPVPAPTPQTLYGLAEWVLVWFGYFLAWTATYLALLYHWEVQEQERRFGEMRTLAQEAQMAALRYQVSPHFLFNTLNSISSLVNEGRNADAERMLLSLSTFFRSTLTTEAGGTVELRDEIGLQRLYLDIEAVRFADRMVVETDIPEGLGRARVPSLILQPLVENAVRYGVGRSEAPVKIRISAARIAGALSLVVEDDGAGGAPDRPGAGIGLANVAERLRAHFSAEARLDARAFCDGGFRAELRMPLQFAAG